jgi:hypothetical protein
MVRKAVRPYSAIEAAFQALDVRDAHLRAFYQPMATQVGGFLSIQLDSDGSM